MFYRAVDSNGLDPYSVGSSPAGLGVALSDRPSGVTGAQRDRPSRVHLRRGLRRPRSATLRSRSSTAGSDEHQILGIMQADQADFKDSDNKKCPIAGEKQSWSSYRKDLLFWKAECTIPADKIGPHISNRGFSRNPICSIWKF